MSYYNRYTKLVDGDEVLFHPNVTLDEKETDKFEIYEIGKTRFDKLSQKYYGVPYFGALIHMANPAYSGLEHAIPHETPLRIPLPLDQTLKEVKEKVEKTIKYYGD